ncbi:DNA polymerase III subunit gamma/tau [Thermosynechococcaceae cyanobacterium BACA0444]|uniref:DNA polymerase III subunit gamma/tau n=1 Tax=Pseudocalidococcus azoricus BACA0444 TaxID=2918990 RepID=A0AAE4FSQ9_9CYAN|nr:DNA polymerase III subunit gamma/tau [Pseudocalidococcus azoricus]MDS3861633.1 DNA polymerase III subunit gamma/tau [Pseudocalidococcus azoricus BACA0444]
MSYEPLHHKYRPQTFADLVGQTAIATTLTNALHQERIAPAYLFCGPRGTGKTSSARILAKSLNCLSAPKPTHSPCGVCDVCQAITRSSALDVIEIDAASNTGVDNIRELIEKSQFAPVQCRYKVYVIDECHMLSTSAFNALLKTLEEPPDRVIFVLATTDPQRVLPTIISRCQRFDFRRIPLADMVSHLTHIAELETININPAAVNLVAQIAQGGLRDAESLLDQLSLLAGEITIERVWDLAGSVPEQDLFHLLQAIKSQHPETLLEQTRQLLERGREPLIVLQNLTGFYRDFLIAKTAPNRQDLVALTPDTWNALCEFAQSWSSQEILAGQQHLRACELQVKNTTQPRLWLEVGLLGLLSLSQTDQSSPPPAHSPRPPAQTPPIPPAVISPPPSQPVANAILPTATPPRPPVSENLPTQAPSPSPAKSPPPAPTPQAPDPPDLNLSHLWQQGIQLVQFPGTQALLSQHGQLLSCSDREIRIGLPSPGLLKLTQKYQDKIEIAFQTALGKPVKVRLEIATSSPELAQSSPAVQPRPTPPPPDPILNSRQPPAPPPENPPAPEFQLAPPAPPDALSQATQSFARFFAGEIVSPEPGSPPLVLESEPLSPDRLMPATDEPELPPELEEDLPF